MEQILIPTKCYWIPIRGVPGPSMLLFQFWDFLPNLMRFRYELCCIPVRYMVLGNATNNSWSLKRVCLHTKDTSSFRFAWGLELLSFSSPILITFSYEFLVQQSQMSCNLRPKWPFWMLSYTEIYLLTTEERPRILSTAIGWFGNSLDFGLQKTHCLRVPKRMVEKL